MTGESTTRPRMLPWLLVILLIALAAWLGWRAFAPEEEGDIVASALVVFEKQNELTVFSSRFEVVAESVSTPSVGPVPVEPLKVRQAMIVPATVEYRLDLSEMTREDFDWDPETRTLDVTLPPIAVSRPNLNEAEARYFTDGLFVSREASVSLGRSNSEQAERRALSFARNPEVMDLARSAARAAVRQNLSIPLEVAGYDEAVVNARFAGDDTAP